MHISNICSRPKKQIGMVYVWDPYLVKDIVALESVQRFATKICTKAWEDVDYDERLRMLNLPTLKAVLLETSLPI